MSLWSDSPSAAVPPPAWWVAALTLAGAAFLLRVFGHRGRRPLSPDTWYYLAYADAVRRRPGFDTRLPQYLLQDARQSYPPLFPMLLALFPRDWLRRNFWVVPPIADSLHVLLLAWAAWKFSGDVLVATLAGTALALAPQAIAEPRALHGRSFAALLQSLAVLLALAPSLTLPALAAGAAVFLASGSLSAAFGFVLALDSLVFRDPRSLLIVGGSLAIAIVLSGGHYLRVAANYLEAVRFWWRNRKLFGAHPIRHSPIYGQPRPEGRRAPAEGLLGQDVASVLLRLLGENPFLLALPLAVQAHGSWGPRVVNWATGLVLLALVVGVVPGLREYGPGRTLMRAAAFPTACALAIAIGERGLASGVGIAAVACLALTATLLATFYHRLRAQAAKQAEPAPDELAKAVGFLADLPQHGVLCLPYACAGYASYNASRPVLWGSHCGDLRQIEALSPVISRPIPELMDAHGVRYLLLDADYAQPADVGLGTSVVLKGRWGRFELYERSAQ